MFRNKRILAGILGLSSLCFLGLGTNPAKASDPGLSSQTTYTMTMPIFNSIAVNTTATNFGTITAADIGVVANGGYEGTHKITVGDNSAASLGYLASNEPSVAGDITTQTYTVAFTHGTTETVKMGAGGLISLSDTAGGTPVTIKVLDHTGAAGAKLGGVALTETDGTTPNFTTAGSTGPLTFIDNGVLGSGDLTIAPLDMTLSLDESTLSKATLAGNRVLTVTFSSTTLTADGGAVAP